ncbi:hypothetical protein P7K49_013391 [Saguinus oedipus]|uniref:Uncharacterized protein n=1 Tax=Saguinus oedipus TaxID=9490 RepID=A0ABQ9VG08_SAGOE|nr:hypothetical protein P7K49_013391 [Saguinus oedipus]
MQAHEHEHLWDSGHMVQSRSSVLLPPMLREDVQAVCCWSRHVSHFTSHPAHLLLRTAHTQGIRRKQMEVREKTARSSINWNHRLKGSCSPSLAAWPLDPEQVMSFNLNLTKEMNKRAPPNPCPQPASS